MLNSLIGSKVSKVMDHEILSQFDRFAGLSLDVLLRQSPKETILSLERTPVLNVIQSIPVTVWY